MNSTNERTKVPLKRTKILSTMGPSTNSFEQIEAAFLAGADAFRMNFSHGDHAEHQGRYDAVRAVEAKHNTPILTLADMQGPKLRVGVFKNGKETLVIGQEFTLDLKDEEGDNTRVKIPHPQIIEVSKPGMNLLVNDGNIRLVVKEVGADYLRTEVAVGGVISDKKGVNVPDAILPGGTLTEKDKKDLEAALEMGADWIAISFVQTKEDVEYAKSLIKGRAPVISKIEKPSALENIDGIIEASDAIMIARGDLGVEIPFEEVYAAERMLIEKSRAAGKPVVCATQMVESMTENPVPTRAEVTDVATAIALGADSVMLSGETANGDYPVEAITAMRRIAESVEKEGFYMGDIKAKETVAIDTIENAIAKSVCAATYNTTTAMIADFTTDGNSTRRISKDRPAAPIIAVTEDATVARRLMFSYAVNAFVCAKVEGCEAPKDVAIEIAKNFGYAKEGETIVVTSTCCADAAGMQIVKVK